MVIGIVLLVFAIFVVLIGTTPSEAKVLYYDTQNTKAQGAGAEENTGDAEEEMPAIVEEEPGTPQSKMKVTVAGNDIQQSTAVLSKDDKLAALRAAAKGNDPVKVQSPQSEAQQIFDDIKEGRL